MAYNQFLVGLQSVYARSAISLCLDSSMYGCVVDILIATTGNLSIIVKVRKNVRNYFEFFFAITNFVSDNNDGG